MLFNSGVFLQFFAAFLLLYWLVRNHLRARNLLVLTASYVFYGWWDWRFLLLLFFSSSFDFAVGLGLGRLAAAPPRRWLLGASIAVNLLILGFFKYYNFFSASLAELLARLNLPVQPWSLSIILPVGISFYTFQSMSYAIDVYRRQLQPTRSYLNFLAYVAFFPQLVAGPIQRANHLLPQFEKTLLISRAMVEEGVWLMIWGMFKKVVVADNLAPLADLGFGGSSFTGPSVLLGTLAFALQIYGDFSGYSDIARGSARVLGFDIIWNFDLPYAATSVRAFWRRWHISFSSWLRDYLYISLGGNRRGRARTYLNLMLTMGLGGLWHGAAWNYVLWGLWHGVGLVAQRAWQDVTGPAPATAPNQGSSCFARGLGWLATSIFILYGWLLFRAGSWNQIQAMTRALLDWTPPAWTLSFVLNLLCFSAPIVLLETWQVRRRNRLVALTLPRPWLGALEGALLIGILLFWEKKKLAFIYFQF